MAVNYGTAQTTTGMPSTVYYNMRSDAEDPMRANVVLDLY